MKWIRSADVKKVEGKAEGGGGRRSRRSGCLCSRNALKLTRFQERCRLTKRRGGGEAMKVDGRGEEMKGQRGGRGTCGGRRKAGTEAEGVKNGKLKEETLKQEITGEDVASNMGQKSQSKTQSLTFIRRLNSFPGKPHTACHYYCIISYLISFVCVYGQVLFKVQPL